MRRVAIRIPDDFHLHARRCAGTPAYLARSAAHYGRALVMPNVEPVPRDGPSVAAYAAELRASSRGMAILPTLKLLPGTPADAIDAAAGASAIACKYYPSGATTNSSDGLRDPDEAADALARMEAIGMPLSIHAEDPDAPPFERERAFLPTIDRILSRYPRLKVIVEHVSTKEAVEAVAAWPDRVAATITACHLAFTADDLLGGGLDARLFCKPILKSNADRDAIRLAAISHPRFFFGSDSAPHSLAKKASFPAPAGCYSSPIALPLLAREFSRLGALDRLEPFCSERGAAFYGLAPNRGTIELVEEAWAIPEELDGCAPPLGGATLEWRVAARG
jgi:dihydroorotase